MARSGLFFAENKYQMMRRGLNEAFEASSCKNLDEYFRLLQASSSSHAEWERLVSLLTV